MNSIIEEKNTSANSSPKHISINVNRLNVLSEIKQCDTLSSVPVEHCDDLLKIRSIKQYAKGTQNNNEQTSIITINVSGDRFQTRLSTLQTFPNTLLGNKNKRKQYWIPETREYFFDRHRACFEAILYYYQSNGRLRRPESVPLDTFLEEITFFELGSLAASQVYQAENIEKVEHSPLPRSLWRRYIWFYFEFPQYSFVARAINLVSILLTILSCISLAIETLPQYNNRWSNICKEQANISTNSTYTPHCSAVLLSPFFIIQSICVIYFTIEFLLRIISTPSYRQFILSFFNWVDLLAVLPYYAFLIIHFSSRNLDFSANTTISIRILRILRFLRIFKMHTVFTRLKPLRILSATLTESLIDFAAMASILTLLAFLFGAVTFFVEQESNYDVFDSIPKSIYWGIITITGVGYGDMVPVSVVGRILSCLCALSGSATVGMLVSTLVDRYHRIYNRKMFLPEPEISTIDLDSISNNDDDLSSEISLQKSNRKRQSAGAIYQGLALFHGETKHDQHELLLSEPQKLQCIVTFNNDNMEDNSAVDRIAALMKKNLTETISGTDINVNLKLIGNDNKELWTISSADSPTIALPNVIV